MNFHNSPFHALGIFLAFVFVLFSGGVHAEHVFSLNSNAKCKVPPKSPPAKLLKKSYQLYYEIGDWEVIDINGDGWCDWMRNGYEASRFDQDNPQIHELIYLGTKSGWRYMGQSAIYKGLSRSKRFDLGKGYLLLDAPAYGFYQPVPVYMDGELKPYIVIVSRPDGPAPPPNQEQIDVLRWDDKFDTFHSIEGDKRLLIIDFLQRELCRDPPISDWKSYRFQIVEGNLCKLPLMRR